MMKNHDDFMLISEFARKLGITPRTVRLYERMGLVGSPHRSDGRFRCYCEADVKQFEFVLELKKLGITLEKMQILAEISSSFDIESRKSAPLLSEHLELLDMHAKNIKLKIESLMSLQTDIERFKINLIYNCSAYGPGAD